MDETKVARRWCMLAVIASSWLLASEPARAALHGQLEAPALNASQIANVQGWVYTTTPGAELIQPFDVLIDGVKAMEVPCCSSRGDVQDQHPEAPLQTGFSGVLNWAREALAADGEITVSVVIRDTAGDELHLEETVRAHTLVTFPYSRSVSFLGLASEDARDERVSASCWLRNDVRLAPIGDDFIEELIGVFVCSNLVAQRGDGEKELCKGVVDFSWDTASQGFKQSSSCDETGRWIVGGRVAMDTNTGLEWEVKSDYEGLFTPVFCDSTDGPGTCSDPNDVHNFYTWSTLLSRRNGSAFTAFLGPLNEGRVGAGTKSTGCFAGYCDWRIPTIEELLTLFEPCTDGTCFESPFKLASIGVYASSTLTPELDAVWGVHVRTGLPTKIDLDEYAPAIAVRGAAFRDSES